ncbi:MAG: Band 7 protein [Verrucomicrobiales bacterium]|nr:Band 7 protein [Verrucomicrobiales bacterium]
MTCSFLAGAFAPSFALVLPWSMTLLSLAVVIPVCWAAFLIHEKMLRRLAIFFSFVLLVGGLELWWTNTQEPELAANLAVEQFHDSSAKAAELRAFTATNNAFHFGAGAAVFIAALVCFGGYAQELFKNYKIRKQTAATVALALLALPLLSGCMKPFDKPEYIEIDTSETGFLIPLEGDGGQQSKFQSEDYLKQRKVAAKRVQITHRWSQEGRMENNGRWITSVRLVKVNRSPITREWTTEQAPSGAGARRNDKAIWIESGDSVGFSMGFNCTAFIAEDNAAKFLYGYPSGSLADVMDHEIRGRIQQVGAEVAAKYPLDALRARKQEIVDAVKNDVTAFFATRGVSVTTVGMFGGMTYENPEIQKSIDQTFIAQQLKVVSEAKFEAQKKENERIELEANAVAERARREASGLADAKMTTAKAEAESIRNITQALNEAQNPVLYQLKALEVEKARVEKWDGRYPMWYMGGANGGMPNLLMQVSPPTGTPVAK